MPYRNKIKSLKETHRVLDDQIHHLELINADPLYRDWETDRKSTRLNSSHSAKSRMPSSA